jgi:hypothetical protein
VTARWGLALVAAAAGCGGVTGTVSLELVTAPGSDVLDDVVVARLTLSSPPTVIEAQRGTDGRFRLELDVPADGPAGRLTFEGFAAGGERIAIGRSAALPIAAYDAEIAIYVARPDTLAAAPVALEPARDQLGVATYGFGVLVVGGRAADGAAVDDVQIYNVYTHAWQVGVPLPAPRARPIVGGSASGYAYVLGGDGPDGAATGTLWRYDTTAAPAGAVLPLVEQPALARAGEPIAIVRSEAFVVGGTPPVVIDGFTRSLTAAGELPSLAGGAATAVVRTAETEEVFAVFVGAGTGASGLVRLASDGVLDEAAAPASARRTGHAVVALGDERILAIGGAVDGALVADAVIASPGPRLYLTQPDVLATPRVGAAVAVAGGLVVVAGGTDGAGAVVGTAEVFDAATLAPRAVVPMVVPRTGAVARPLDSGQVLIVGGRDALGAPVATVELFTPG